MRASEPDWGRETQMVPVRELLTVRGVPAAPGVHERTLRALADAERLLPWEVPDEPCDCPNCNPGRPWRGELDEREVRRVLRDLGVESPVHVYLSDDPERHTSGECLRHHDHPDHWVQLSRGLTATQARQTLLHELRHAGQHEAGRRLLGTVGDLRLAHRWARRPYLLMPHEIDANAWARGNASRYAPVRA